MAVFLMLRRTGAYLGDTGEALKEKEQIIELERQKAESAIREIAELKEKLKQYQK